MTIADLILSTRRLIPDMPGSLPSPVISAISQANIGGNDLPPGQYYLVCTQLNTYGESASSNELSIDLTSANNTIEFEYTASPDATTIRTYLTLPGGFSGGESLYFDTPITELPIEITIFIRALPRVSSYPPSRPSAWLPQTDGKQFSTGTLYQWLNDGLNKLSHAVNGIQDYCGVPALSGQPLYVISDSDGVGQWLSISDVWYGGYWIQGGQRMWFYRRDSVTSDILSSVAISIQSDKQVMEVSYQPDRTSGITDTTADMLATDTSVAISNPGAFLLPFGFASIGTPNPASPSGGGTEIVAYSSVTNGVMSGLIRGIGSTVAQAWPSGTQVNELGLFWCGRRVFGTPYWPSVNPTTTHVPVPYGWKPILVKYMLAQAKYAEQDVEKGSTMEKEAFADAQKWMLGNRGVSQFVQVGGSNRPLVFDQTVAGGVIIPG